MIYGLIKVSLARHNTVARGNLHADNEPVTSRPSNSRSRNWRPSLPSRMEGQRGRSGCPSPHSALIRSQLNGAFQHPGGDLIEQRHKADPQSDIGSDDTSRLFKRRDGGRWMRQNSPLREDESEEGDVRPRCHNSSRKPKDKAAINREDCPLNSQICHKSCEAQPETK